MIERSFLTVPVRDGEVYFSDVPFLNHFDEGHPDQQTARLIEKVRETLCDLIVVSDIDETVENSVPVWIARFKYLCTQILNYSDFPPDEEIAENGGSHWFKNTVRDFDPEAFDLIHAYYQAVNIINGDVTSMEESDFLSTVHDQLDWFFAGFLTTRPGTEPGYTSTRKKLREHFGLRNETPVIMRPSEIMMQDTEEWKLAKLEQIVSETGKPVVMVDDNIGLAMAIKERNQQLSELPNFVPIVSVIYPGPRTRGGDIAEIVDEELWIFSSNWKEMRGLLSYINAKIQSVS